MESSRDAMLHAVIATLRAGGDPARHGVRVETLWGDAATGVFRVTSVWGDHVVKLCARDTDALRWMALECDATRWAASRGFAPTVVLTAPDAGALVTQCVPDAELPMDRARAPETLRRVGELFRAVHTAQPVLDVPGTLRADLDSALETAVTAIEPALRARLGAALPAVWTALDASPLAVTTCHNDPHPGNVFDTGGNLLLIDWASGALGDPGWDLAVYASGADLDDAACGTLWDAWGGPGTHPRLRVNAARWTLLADVYNLAWYLQVPGDDPLAAARYARRVGRGLSALGM